MDFPAEYADLLSSLQEKSDHDLLIVLNLQMKQSLDRLERGDKRMADLDSRLCIIEDQHKGEKAVVSFLDTTIGRISTCAGILSVSLALIVVYVLPPVMGLLKVA